VGTKKLETNQRQKAPRLPRMIDDIAILELLGTGAYAKVYLGKQIKSGALVAVKVIDISQPHKRKSVEVELQALRLLNHENIVKLHKVVQQREVASMVLEYLPEPDLLTHLNECGVFTEADAIILMTQLVDAIRHCHEAGIAHHDIKPENISYDKVSKTVKLFDFGLSIAHRDGNQPCTCFSGSPLYLPPEVINAVPYDPFSADIWGLGVLLYELLTNAVPYEAQTWDELVKEVNDPDYRIHFPSFFSPELVELLTLMLDKNPETRISLEEIQRHPWMTHIDVCSSSDSEDYVFGESLLPCFDDEFLLPMDMEVDHAHTTVVA